MSDEPTAWEDINPPMASVRRHELQSRSLEARTIFRNELTACLTLVAPAGMTEEARRDWFAVAWETLKHLPPHILSKGARKAREKCDHPSKIVPTILAETAEDMVRNSYIRELDNDTRRLPAPKPNYCTPAEAAEILQQYGIGSGVKNTNQAEAEKARPDRERRKPTREDYISLGVDPVTLDHIANETPQ